MAELRSGTVIWAPSAERAAGTNLRRFMDILRDEFGEDLRDYQALHEFSVRRAGEFWSAAWKFCGVIGNRGTGPALQAGEAMQGAKWFPDAKLNFAENLLRVRDERIVISAWDESGHRCSLSGMDVHDEVSRIVRALQAEGVVPRDRIAGYLPNVPRTMLAMLATTSLGAIWTLCSPELGAPAVIERFRQIEPTVLFVTGSNFYAGQRHNLLLKSTELARALPSVRRVVVVDSTAGNLPGLPSGRAVDWEAWLSPHATGDIKFERFAFDHPCYVLYTSGTTGAPKCIVHGTGGTLLKHLVDQILQHDVGAGDRVFRVTTAGWMLWNSLASALACEATAVLYDGSPFHPRVDVLLDVLQRERVTMWGVAPAILERYEREGLKPRLTHDLAALKCVVAGGMPLAPHSYVWTYENLKCDLHLASPSGGTDIISFFAGGNPIGPCRIGEIQVPALGIQLEIFDDTGRSIVGEPGELVCTRPFPSTPVGFWGDKDGVRYHSAYYARYPGVWTHGDWAQITPHGSVIIYGRSDATLKSRGVRIGTSEIYRELELFTEIAEAVAVDQRQNGSSRIVLFLTLRPDAEWADDLTQRVRRRIAERASPRHVPDLIVHAPNLPRTGSGKVSELAVRDAVSGVAVANAGSLANPESLDFFYDFARTSVHLPSKEIST